MTALWKKTNEAYESSAKVVDGNLIISLPDALNPVVWRMELGSVKASALEVRAQADGAFLLYLKTPKGDVHEIAPFETRDLAVRALMRVSNALQNASGKMVAPSLVMPGASTAQEMPSRPALSGAGPSSLKWVIALVGVLVVIFLFAKVSNMAREHAVGTAAPQQTGTTAAPASDGQNGVPQSADDVLRGF